MRKLLFGIIIVILLSTSLGCKQTDAAKIDSGFRAPETAETLDYMRSVRTYMYYRTQAVLNNDITFLWRAYPDLKNNIDLKQGINIEQYEIETLNNGFDLIDANYDIEGYERIKAKVINENERIVLVHGLMTYLRTDFDESGGEYLMQIFLEKRDEQWTVVRTDAYTLPEYKEWQGQK